MVVVDFFTGAAVSTGLDGERLLGLVVVVDFFVEGARLTVVVVSLRSGEEEAALRRDFERAFEAAGAARVGERERGAMVYECY